MSNTSAVAVGIAEAERRIDALQVLCEIFSGQLKGERRQLEEIKMAVAASIPGAEQSGQAGPLEIGPEELA